MKITTKLTEQDVLDKVTVRLILDDEKERWDQIVKREHYLQNARLVGEQLRYVAEVDGKWMALISWSGAAYHIAGRDRWIGWSDQQRRNRLHFLVSNSRFLLRTDRGKYPNLASRILRLCLERLDRDWRVRYNHGLLLAETFVDIESYAGTCYKASNWVELGKTKGFERSGKDYYESHDRPKRLFIRPLQKDAQRLLAASVLPECWADQERFFHPGCQVKVPALRSLFEQFNAITDPRAIRGRRYPIGCLLTIAFCAVLAGAQGYEAIADYASLLSQPQRRSLRCWKRRNGKYDAPKTTTFWELFNAINREELDRVVGAILRALGNGHRPEAIAVDGKIIRSTRPDDEYKHKLNLFAALAHDQPIVQNQLAIDDKSNEIPALPKLLEPLDLDGVVITADALNTQRQSARHIVQDKGGDYLFTVKDNQPSLKKRIESLFEDSTFSLSPSYHRNHQR